MSRSLLTVAEAATWLRLSPQRVYDLTARGELPHLRPAKRRILFDEADLRAYMERRAQETIAERTRDLRETSTGAGREPSPAA